MSKVKEELWQEPIFDIDRTPIYEQDNAMHISKMNESKYIKIEDVEPPILVTISRVDKKDVSLENAPSEMKWVLYFSELDKGLTLGLEKNISIANALASEDTDEWLGKKIVLFNDPSITYQGKVTGGVRGRAPKAQAASVSEAPKEFNDDVGF